MSKEDMQDIKEVMKSFDPVLVAMAIGEIGVKSELVNKEVANIRTRPKAYRFRKANGRRRYCPPKINRCMRSGCRPSC